MQSTDTIFRTAPKIRTLIIAMAAAIALILAGGCSKIKEIQVTSVGVKYVTPVSARSVEGVLLLGIDNPAMGFTVSNVEGVIRHYDRVMGFFTAGTVPVMARTAQVYELPCTATLAEDVSFLDVMAIAARRSLDGMTADVTLNIKLGSGNGKGMKLKFKKIDLSSE